MITMGITMQRGENEEMPGEEEVGLSQQEKDQIDQIIQGKSGLTVTDLLNDLGLRWELYRPVKAYLDERGYSTKPEYVLSESDKERINQIAEEMVKEKGGIRVSAIVDELGWRWEFYRPVKAYLDERGYPQISPGPQAVRVAKSTKKGVPIPLTGAATIIGVSHLRVRDIIREGNLPGWVYTQDGTELVPYEPRPKKETIGPGIMVFKEDAKLYKKLRDAQQEQAHEAEEVTYTLSDSDKQRIEEIAARQVEEKGYVSKVNMLNELKWRSYQYPALRIYVDALSEEKGYPQSNRGHRKKG